MNEESQQPNPSPHRSFHPDKYAPEADRPRGKTTKEEKEASGSGTPLGSMSGRGEDQAERSSSRGMHDTGRRGRSRRPSGAKDPSAFTGIDPDDSPTGDGSR
ncbi:hypothetical protein CW362_07035 [Streptomyces populi]|uniref:Uncharacterized protein n=1 Tax=Streptomyces populi TaxID=2058924 RepID=A0A2I0SV59_9ACTN|nr:hypothetical protein CW362_07035 [Streptomyces populi]